MTNTANTIDAIAVFTEDKNGGWTLDLFDRHAMLTGDTPQHVANVATGTFERDEDDMVIGGEAGDLHALIAHWAADSGHDVESAEAFDSGIGENVLYVVGEAAAEVAQPVEWRLDVWEGNDDDPNGPTEPAEILDLVLEERETPGEYRVRLLDADGIDVTSAEGGVKA